MHREDGLQAIQSSRSLLHGFVSLERGRGFGPLRDTDECFTWLVATYVQGIGDKEVRK